MGLQPYRRHRKARKAERPEDSRTGKFEEGRRGWKECSCQIYASGTLGRKFRRQCTGNWEWAEDVARPDIAGIENNEKLLYRGLGSLEPSLPVSHPHHSHPPT